MMITLADFPSTANSDVRHANSRAYFAEARRKHVDDSVTRLDKYYDYCRS